MRSLDSMHVWIIRGFQDGYLAPPLEMNSR